jgi:uncharacterized protein (DUF1778 family)
MYAMGLFRILDISLLPYVLKAYIMVYSMLEDRNMAVPAYQTEPRRDARIAMRLSSEHKTEIERAAAIAGLDVTAFVTSIAINRSREIIADYQGRILDNEARDRFLALLESDTEPSADSRRVAERFNRGNMSEGRYVFEL